MAGKLYTRDCTAFCGSVVHNLLYDGSIMPNTFYISVWLTQNTWSRGRCDYTAHLYIPICSKGSCEGTLPTVRERLGRSSWGNGMYKQNYTAVTVALMHISC